MKIIGHRGAREEAPENTVAGFVHAQENGCYHFELDIQLSSDGELVVYHDKNLSRTSGLAGKVGHLPYSTLRHIDSRKNTPGWHSPCFIPSLEQVIRSVSSNTTWQFEVKSDHRHVLKLVIRRLIEIYEEHNLHKTAVVTSANGWLLHEIKRLSPSINTGYVAEYRYRRPLRTALALNCNLLAVSDRLVSPMLVKKAQAQELEVSVWTVNNLDRMEYLNSIGVDSIITDIPSLALLHFNQL